MSGIPTHKAELKYVSPKKLEFDPDNPRFAGQFEGKTQEQIQTGIFGAPHFAGELVDSFIENGFIDYEPLIVKEIGNKFLVIEGNRRLAAVKHILDDPAVEEDKKADLLNIPVLVFSKQAIDEEKTATRVYLGIRHLLGFREWPPLAKAKFLEGEIQKLHGDLDRVLREVGLTKQQAKRFLVPYRLLTNARITLPPAEDFWVLGEALNRTGVKDFLQLEVNSPTLEIVAYKKDHLGLLLDDLYGPKKASGRDRAGRKIGDTRDISTLAKVLSSPTARNFLHNGKSLKEATIYVDSKEESVERLIHITSEMKLLLKKLVPADPAGPAKTLMETFAALQKAVTAFKKHA